MTQPGKIDPAEILTPQEIESVELAENLYSARAKQSADELGRVVGLDDETRGRLVGGLGLRLAEVDFEQRREVSHKLDEVAAILGGITSKNSLGLVQTEPVISEVIELPDDSETSELTNDLADERTDSQDKLKTPQQKWFATLFNQQIAERITELSQDEIDQLAEKITGIYLNLSIMRLGPEAKQRRAQQLKDFVGGRSIKELAQEQGVTLQAAAKGLENMAMGIRKRVPEQQLLDLLGTIEIEQSADNESEDVVDEADVQPKDQEPVPLMNDQVRWFTSLFDGNEVIEPINQMDPSQREQIIVHLSQRLKPAILKRYGAHTSQTRVITMSGFLRGATIDEIALERRISNEAIKQELYHAASRLKATVPKEDLLQFVAEAQTSTEN